MKLTDAMVEMNLAPNISEAGRLILQGSVRVNSVVRTDTGMDLDDGARTLMIGRRRTAIVQVTTDMPRVNRVLAELRRLEIHPQMGPPGSLMVTFEEMDQLLSKVER